MEDLAGNLETYLKASVALSFLAAFLGGVLAGFTPCVYPMIPITAGYVGSSNLGGSKFRGFVLSLCYVLGVALTYAALGMIAALTGRFFGEISSNPWAYFIVANIIIILGLGMLEVYNMPSFGMTGSGKPGGLLGIFLLGIASGFVAGPCMAPVMGVLLAYVATTQSVVFGGSLLFVFALGMGLLLVIVGTFSGVVASLPRSGEWMVKIKKGLGLFMIGLGEYFLIKMGQLMF
ncbi:cytochrome c biogenesis protein CcdA [Thermodesulfobacteriota bacterium]